MPGRFAFRNEPRRRPPTPVSLGFAGDLFDRAVKPRAKRKSTPASGEAADLAYLRSYDVALRALRHLATHLPLTSNECARELGVDDQALRPRFTQMKERGWLEALEERRPTGHGGKAHVHRITEAGRSVLLLLGNKESHAA